MTYIEEREYVSIFPLREIQLPESSIEAGDSNGTVRELLLHNGEDEAYRLPARHIDPGDNRHETAFDLAKEIDCLNVPEVRTTAVTDSVTVGPYPRRVEKTYNIYLVSVLDGDLTGSGDCIWVPADRIDDYLTAPRHHYDLMREINRVFLRADLDSIQESDPEDVITARQANIYSNHNQDSEQAPKDRKVNPEKVSNQHKTLDSFENND